jgi:hypothetical protein
MLFGSRPLRMSASPGAGPDMPSRGTFYDELKIKQREIQNKN